MMLPLRALCLARIGLSIPGGFGRPLTGVAAGRALCCLSERALSWPECSVVVGAPSRASHGNAASAIGSKPAKQNVGSGY